MTREPLMLWGISVSGWLILTAYFALTVLFLWRFRAVIEQMLRGVINRVTGRRKAKALADAWDKGFEQGASDERHERWNAANLPTLNPYRRRQ